MTYAYIVIITVYTISFLALFGKMFDILSQTFLIEVILELFWKFFTVNFGHIQPLWAYTCYIQIQQ